jgi:hypothetical protein
MLRFVLFLILSVSQSIAGTIASISLPAPQKTWKSSDNTNYYVDSLHGDDANDGLSKARPWRTLNHINAGEFAPGDKILLCAGSKWRGFLSPGGSGARGRPIVIDQYGRGAKPRIDAEESSLAAVFLSNSEYIEVRNLDVANSGPPGRPNLNGVKVSVVDFGTAHDIVLENLYVHDVNGSNVKSSDGSAIDGACGGNRIKSRFDGLLIEHCHLVHTDRNGITTHGNWERNHWYPSLHVVIRGNLLEDIGGDGIVPRACDGALVEHNILKGGRMRAEDYAAGIWPWGCDNTVVQYNEVSGMKGTRDGEGYDSDYNCRGTVFQYNFSHNNDGGFMLVCNNGTAHKPKYLGNIGTIVRYNISVNDKFHTFNITGPCRKTLICNNVLYIGKNQVVTAVSGGKTGNVWSDDTRFINNIFYVDKGGSAVFDVGGMTRVVFDHNAFWGRFKNRPVDVHAVLGDPRLVAPGSLSPTGYEPGARSPCLNAGMPIFHEGIHDLRRRSIAGARPSIGAFQTPPDR